MNTSHRYSVQNHGLPQTKVLRFKIVIARHMDQSSIDNLVFPIIKNTLSKIQNWDNQDWNSLTSWKELYLNTDLPMDKFIVTYYQTDLSDSEMTTFNCIIFFKDKVQINIDMCNNFNIKNDWKDIPFKTLDLQRVHQPIKLIKHLFNYQPDFHCSPTMLKGIYN